MLDLAFIALLAAWSAIVGRAMLRCFGPIPEHRADVLALALPMGLGALAMAVLGLAELGGLGGPGLIAIAVAGLVVAWAAGVFRRESRGRAERPVAQRSRVDRGFDAALAAILLGSLLTALAPPTDGDALCYHLQVPKLFLWSGSIFFEPDLHETVYPLVTELLYAVGLAVRGAVACRLIQWVLGIGFALNVAALARPYLGARARWASALALGVPAVSNGMGAPLNDVALACFATAALAAWSRWVDRPTLGAAALAGVLGGLAMGVKYPALVWVGVLGLAMPASAAIGRWPGDGRGLAIRKALGHAAVFGAAAIVVGGPWYLRAYLHTGNPVHPFFRDAFGGAGFDVVLSGDKRPMTPNPWNLLTSLAPMTLNPGRFDSIAHEFGPAFLLFLPALVLRRPPARLAGLVAIGYAFLVLCMSQRQSMRFVLPCVGPMAVGVAWLASGWERRGGVPDRLLTAALLLMLTFQATVALGRSRHGLRVAFGLESAESFLDRREPTFRVGRWVDAHLPSDARLVGQDHRGFYIPRSYAMEKAHRRRTGLGTRGESPAEVVDHFRRAGFTHLLMCPPVPEDAVEFDPELGRLLEGWLEGRTPIYDKAIADADGVVRRYALFELDVTAPKVAGAASEARR